jgi:opacity protein-like surface antigen
MKKRLMAAAVALFVSSAPVSAAPVQNEIMFMLDSSDGPYDPAYGNWNAQIGWVQNFINQTHRADGSNA